MSEHYPGFAEAFDMLPRPQRQKLLDEKIPAIPGVEPTHLDDLTKNMKTYLYRCRVNDDRRRIAAENRRAAARELQNNPGFKLPRI